MGTGGRSELKSALNDLHDDDYDDDVDCDFDIVKKKKKKNQYCVYTPDRTHSAGTTDDDK